VAGNEQFKELDPQPKSETQLQMGRAVYLFGWRVVKSTEAATLRSRTQLQKGGRKTW